MKKKYILFDILVVSIIILVCIGYTERTLQNDTFYTIPIGRNIIKYGIDMLDHFSIHNLSYTYPHWLYDVCVYLIYNIGGFKLLYISTIFLYIVIGLLIYFLTKNLYKYSFVSAFVSISAVIALKYFIAVRAQTVTYVLFILEIFFIEKFLSTNNKKYLISLPIISLLIVNMHCAVWVFFFILFLPVIGEYLVSSYKNKQIKIKKFFKPSGKYLPCRTNINILNERIEVNQNRNVKYLIIVMVICLFTGFITLNRLTPFTYLIKTLQGNTINWIGEHQPPTLRYTMNLICYLCFYIFILTFVKQKLKLREFFLLTGLFILAFCSYRHISLLVICSSFAFVRIISNSLENNNKGINNLFIKIFTKKAIFALTIILSILLSLSSYYGKKINEQKYIDESVYPVFAADYILKNLDVKNIRLYNEYNYGSYLLFRGIPVFVDSRADLYTIPFSGFNRDMTDDFLNAELDYKTIFEYYKITHVMIYRYNEEFNKTTFYEILSLDTNYTLIYEDKYFAIFEKIL